MGVLGTRRYAGASRLGPRRRRWAQPARGAAALGLVALCLLSLFPGSAQGSKLLDTRSDLAAARSQLGRLQAEVDELAGNYARSEARLYELDDAVEAAEKDEARSRGDLDLMQAQLTKRVVHLYKDRSGMVPLFLEVLFDSGDFSAVTQRFGLLNRVAAQDRETLEQVDTHLEKVLALEKDLAQKKLQQEQKMAELKTARQTMETRMQAVAVEYRRLKQRVATLEEEARRAAEAERARAKASVASSRGAPVAAKGFVFPVDGPHSYINDWGFARSGGRSHKGTDIMAPRGTAVVAVVGGRIRRTAYGSGLGGTIVWLDGSNGSSYYFAHLDGIAGGIRSGVSVRAGQLIGRVGSTGNARGGSPHLHFEIHPGGGGAINPHFILRASD